MIKAVSALHTFFDKNEVWGGSQEAKLAPKDADLNRFGVSVYVKGDTVVVGDYCYGGG